MKKIIIFGSSYQSNVILNELLALKKNIIGFCDENIPKGKILNKKYKLKNLGGFHEISKKIDKNFYGIIGVGENKIRQKIVNNCRIIKKNFQWASLISKHAIVDDNAEIGEGSIVLSGSVIRNNVKIKRHCLINSSCSIDHDNYLSDFSSCGPGVISGGNVRIGKLSFVGIGSVIKHGVQISDNVIIGGNSYVNRNCQEGNLYFGSPIKKIKKISTMKSQF
jgi:sugar O-acyltransferase (sialic acid O-acetyltransferase NeuD family)